MRLLLMITIISGSMILSGWHSSWAGAIDAPEKCPATYPDDLACMITTSSGEGACPDDLAIGQQALDERAGYDGVKPLGGDIPAVRSIVDPHPALSGLRSILLMTLS